MTTSYIIAGSRTPIGSFLGAFSNMTAPELGATVVRAAIDRANLSGEEIDEVIMGNVLQAGVGQAPARQAALKAGLPNTVAALTVNKVCGSGLKAVMLADQAIRLGNANAIIAGGMECMSGAPHLMHGIRSGIKLGDAKMRDAMIFDGLTCSFEGCHMGIHAEHTAKSNDISRFDQDAFSLQSQKRAGRAIEEGAFDDEIVNVTVKSRRDEITVSRDEGPRPDSTAEGLAKLRTVFESDGTVTAGNASTLSDGAAAVAVVNQEIAERSDYAIKAKIVASFTSGTEPKDLFVAPVAAVNGVLNKVGMTKDDIDLFEINEAFASQMLACIRQLDLDQSKVNVNGGGISLGHPIGASGARVLVTCLYAMKARGAKRGLVSLCLGGGNAVAMIVEAV